MSVASTPSWPYTPPSGWSADDLDRVGTEGPYGELDLLKRVELIDGALVIMSPQTAWHRALITVITRSLEAQVPPGMAVTSEMDVKLGPRQRPVPDVLVITAAAAADLSRTYYDPADVRLAVEVVSDESAVRDRERKPQLYAAAGIACFWRIENLDGKAVAYVFELEPASGHYVPTGIFHEKIKVTTPFPIEVALTLPTPQAGS
ncbi:MAG: Uma2 family endonuclease [Actinobacteria bacterium]|nr:Uma2 family endonuclease [Actinomycetota bacterium]MBO0831898.1 Uma2 family endonuclease [Actinomycetota bacterium]MBO0834720.1 Uma2 family endonuclease [Actinomycetota bacterium]